MLEGLSCQGSKQEVTKVVGLYKNGRKNQEDAFIFFNFLDWSNNIVKDIFFPYLMLLGE